MKISYIALFGLLGIFTRYYVGLGFSKILTSTFPYGTFLINISGAFLIGVIHIIGVERSAISSELRIGIMVGFLGGFTTFSTYCLEAVRLIEDSDYVYAALYFIASPVLGYLAALGGMFLTRFFLGTSSA
jgi:CrcB protein